MHPLPICLIVWSALVLGANGAWALDCSQARSALEKAICADPKAKASDMDMENAFRSAKAMIGAGQKGSLLVNQRSWLKDRNSGCVDSKAPAVCIAERNRARSLVLMAKPAAGPGVPGRLVPVLVEQPGSKRDVATKYFAVPLCRCEHACGEGLEPSYRQDDRRRAIEEGRA